MSFKGYTIFSQSFSMQALTKRNNNKYICLRLLIIAEFLSAKLLIKIKGHLFIYYYYCHKNVQNL